MDYGVMALGSAIMGGLSLWGSDRQAKAIKKAQQENMRLAQQERDRVEAETAKQKSLITAQSERIMANSTRQQQYQSMLLNDLEDDDKNDMLFGFGKNNNPFSNNYL